MKIHIFIPLIMSCAAIFGICQAIYEHSTRVDLFSKKDAKTTKSTIKDSLTVQKNRFDKAFDNLIKEEGGYVNDPADKGWETKYGISKRSYPHLNIKDLTLGQAKTIYEMDFWRKIKGDELPSDEVACEVLEQAVNMGIKTAVKFLQIVCVAEGEVNLSVDGKMGPQTLSALQKLEYSFILVGIKSLAIAHYLKLAREEPPMKKFLKGWIKRVTT